MSQNYDDQIYEDVEEENTNQLEQPKIPVFLSGPISEALQKSFSQQRFVYFLIYNRILFIFISGPNEQSTKLINEIEESDELLELLTQSFVSIKLEVGTENYQFFTEFLKLKQDSVSSTPTIYLLSPKGEIKLKLSNPKLEELVCELVDKITGEETPITPLNPQNFEPISEKKEIEKEKIQEDDPREEELKKIRNERKRLQDRIYFMKKLKESKEKIEKIEKKEEKKVIVEKQKKISEKSKDEEYKKQLLDRIKKEREKRKLENEKEVAKKVQKLSEQPKKQSSDPTTPISHQNVQNSIKSNETKVETPKPKTPQNVQNSTKFNEPKETPKTSTPTSIQIVKETKLEEIKEESPKSKSSTTQIGFRTPDGQVIRGIFQINDKLSVCREFVNQKIQNGEKYQMMTLHPKRYFTFSDYNSTISDLSLSNGTIILSPSKEEKEENTNVNSDSFLRTCPGTIYLMFSTLVDSFFGIIRGNQTSTPSIESNVTQPNVTQSNERSNPQPPNQESQSPGTTQRRVVKKGNIHSFQDEEEKEQKWDNGNSTQFQDHKK